MRPIIFSSTKFKQLDWPLITLASVYHVGYLDPARRGENSPASYEGKCLSVSLVPEVWRNIAKLGAAPVFELQCAPGHVFVDVMDMSDQHWDVVMRWAVDAGLTTRALVYKVSWQDEEAGDRRYSLFGDPEEAREELLEHEDDAAAIEEFCGYLGTPKLDARIGFRVDLMIVKDMSLTLFAEDVLFGRSGVAGLWWREELDEMALSAPRGAIHDRALPHWAVVPVQRSAEHFDDEPSLVDFSTRPVG